MDYNSAHSPPGPVASSRPSTTPPHLCRGSNNPPSSRGARKTMFPLLFTLPLHIGISHLLISIHRRQLSTDTSDKDPIKPSAATNAGPACLLPSPSPSPLFVYATRTDKRCPSTSPDVSSRARLLLPTSPFFSLLILNVAVTRQQAPPTPPVRSLPALFNYAARRWEHAGAAEVWWRYGAGRRTPGWRRRCYRSAAEGAGDGEGSASNRC